MPVKAIMTLREHQARKVPHMHFTEAVIRAAEQIDKEKGWVDGIESYAALRTFAYNNYQKLGEANPASAFGQLLRAGVQISANGWYERTEISHDKYVMESNSNKRQEFYAPLYGSQFPTETYAGEPYSEGAIQGLDIEILNRKYMGGESFSRELFDDDQTGQIKQRMQNLGASQRQLEELLAAGRMLGATALTFGNVTVPASVYTRLNAQGSSVGPYSTTFYGTRNSVAYGNRPAAFVQLSLPAIRTALQALRQAFDPLGVPIAVRPDTLVVSPFDELNAQTFLNSSIYPGVQGLGGQTASNATSGSATGAFADNVLKGMFTIASNLYLPTGAWNLGVKGMGLVKQRRDPMETVQEVPNSGESFNTDTIRFRSRNRLAIEWIDSGFWYQGNDGTASVTQ